MLPKHARKSIITFAVIYAIAYLIASYLDLATTSLGLQRAGVSEKNVFAVAASGYSPFRAWLLTAAGAAVMAGCIVFAVRHAGSVDAKWLQHPIRSLSVFYLNPWSRKAIVVSPLHTLSLVIAFVLLRLAAAANNLLVYLYGIAPMGGLMKALGARTSPAFGFAIVAFSFFLISCIAVLPLAARLMTSWRTPAPA
ncbi:MAG: hypothetical protein ACYC7A_18450 [Thermoanaerobaculia bacterium]